MTTLSDPLKLAHGPTLRNRIAKSAMSERLALADGRVSAELVALYRRWAASGAALLITGNVMVDARALGESGNVFVEDERDLSRLRAWAEAAKSQGAAVMMQINHPGRQAPRTISKHLVAPSAVGLKGPGRCLRSRAPSWRARSRRSSLASPRRRASQRRPASTAYKSTVRTATS
jgi:2,4-dienoyl-CoA reductase-like NADH-dependent reductase (Old Yellow Enzyme family)